MSQAFLKLIAQRARMSAAVFRFDGLVSGFDSDSLGGTMHHDNRVARLWTFFGIFKGTVPLVLLVNSDTPGSVNITDVVVEAFNSGTVPHP